MFQIFKILSPPTFGNDEEKNRTAFRLHTTSVLAIVLTIVYSVFWVAVHPDLAYRLIAAVIMIVMCLSCIWLVRIGKTDGASHLFLGTFWLLTTYIAGTAGGTRAPFFGIYVLIVMTSVLYSGWRIALFYGSISLISGLVMVYLASLGMIVEPFSTPFSAWLTQAALMTLVTMNCYLIIRDVNHSLEKATQALAKSEKTEAALRVSEERFRLITSVTSDYTFSSMINAQGELEHLLLTGAFEAITGYTPQEYLEMGGWRATIHPDDVAQDIQDMETLKQNKRTTSELRFVHKDGSIHWARIYAIPVWDIETQQLKGINGGVKDITKEKQLEQEIKSYTSQLENLVSERTDALNFAKEQLELVLNHTTNALAFADINGDILFTNPAFRETFNESDIKSIEFILWSIKNEAQMEIVGDAIIKAIYDKKTQRIEAQVSSLNGVEKDIDLALIPVLMSEDLVQQGILLSGHDITQMKEIERFKSRFIANAVHDLATPITGMTTRLYLLRHNPEKTSKHLLALENQIQHLRNLLDDLKTLSSLDRMELELDIAPFNINHIAQRVFDIYEPVAIDKNQTLSFKTLQDLPEILIDQRNIERVFINLVSNAINYTDSHKRVSIETLVENQMAVFRVVDEGMGIQKEDLTHIFERFYRTDEARGSLSTGTGLGLAICKEIVEMHNGHIEVSSSHMQGSVFSIFLPIQENSKG